jgi:enamine deaminase RidA (YjgF/YER057c/UK114 family)
VSEKRIIEPEDFPWLDYKRYTFSMGVEKSGVLFLSGETASEYDPASNRVVCKGNIVEQTRLAYEKIKRVLEAAGGSFNNVVRTVDYVNPQGLADYRGTAAVRQEYFDGSWPVATGIMVERLLRPDALIEVDAIAVLDAKKESVNPGWARYDRLTYQPGVRAGDLLCISGMIGTFDYTGSGEERPRSTAAEQTVAIYDTMGQVLKAAGANPGDLVKTMDYITPACVSGYGSTAELRRQFSQGVLPASSGIVMNSLLRPEALLEIDSIAVMGGQRREVQVPGWAGHRSGLPCPPGIRNGKYLFISGQTALDPRTGSIVGGDDVIAQCRQAYTNIREVVEAAGGTLNDICKTTEFVTPQGLDNYRAVGDLRKELFGAAFPAATGVVVNSVPSPGLLIYVDAIAILD